MATTAQSPEAEIQHLIDEWRSALCARDLDRLMQHYADDVVFYDAVPPFYHQGADAYRQTWAVMFDFLPPQLVSEVCEVNITVSGNLALMHCLQHLTNAETGQSATCGWVRVTVGYRREQGAWKVFHEHVSVPFDPNSAQAVFTQERP